MTSRAFGVLAIPNGGDYLRCLYTAMPEGCIREVPLGPWLDLLEVDIVHVHVPERPTPRGEWTPEVFRKRYLEFIDELARSVVKVVWTVHNRRPHRGEQAWGERLYRAWADASDAAIHHTRWGEAVARAELPFRDGILHTVIPHGHFGALMPEPHDRRALEEELGLSPCALRFGVLGQPLPARRAEMAIRAFHRAGVPNHELLVTSVPPETSVPDDPRIHVLPHRAWRTREEVTRNLAVCDVLVCPHAGDSYLTSGQVGDAIGMGRPVIASLGFFHEAMEGATWAFDGTEEGLAAVFGSLTPDDVGPRSAAALERRAECAWDQVAKRTLEVYRGVVDP